MMTKYDRQEPCATVSTYSETFSTGAWLAPGVFLASASPRAVPLFYGTALLSFFPQSGSLFPLAISYTPKLSR